MTAVDPKTEAALRVLVAVARADGHLDDRERQQVLSAFPNHRDLVERALGEAIDLEVELAVIGEDSTFRKHLFRTAYAVAYADGRASSEEVATLRKIYEDDGETSLIGQVLGEARDTLLPVGILPVPDPVQRQQEVLEDTFKYAVLSAVAGAMPIPGLAVLTDLLVVGLQVKLVRDIGQYHGHDLDGKAARSLVGTIAGGTGLRIAVSNLMKLVPGWGSAVGAASSFASTFAVGKVADAYFQRDQALDPDAIRTLFEAAKQEGQAAYGERKSQIDAVAQQSSGLSTRLARGEVSVEQAVAELDDVPLAISDDDGDDVELLPVTDEVVRKPS